MPENSPSGLNVPLLEAVKQNLSLFPEHFDMEYYYVKSGNKPCYGVSDAQDFRALHEALTTPYNSNFCNTTGCIAGHLIILSPEQRVLNLMSKYEEHCYSTIEVAANLLGVSASEARNLFFEASWPFDLREDFMEVSEDTTLPFRERQKILSELAIKAIDRFIQDASDNWDDWGWK